MRKVFMVMVIACVGCGAQTGRAMKVAAPAERATLDPKLQPPGSGARPSEFKHHDVLPRDPFRALIQPPRPGEAVPEVRGPGKASLAVDEIAVIGVALGGPTGNVALVSGHDEHTYFLRSGDHIHDGVVLKIEPNGVLFQKRSRSAESAASTDVFKKIS